MTIIKLDAIDSTNSFLRKLYTYKSVEDFTVVTTKLQTNGRGQMGTVWASERCKNLTFSVFVNTSALQMDFPFYLSMVTATAVSAVLQDFFIPKISVKWPNDILSQDKKLCGILIENVMKKGVINASIIGIGLNVNQINFENLPKATSLSAITGKIYDLDEVLEALVKKLKAGILAIEQKQFETIKANYEANLFRKNKPSTFKDAKGNLFSGFIKGVTNEGNLRIVLEDNIVKTFTLKALTLLY